MSLTRVAVDTKKLREGMYVAQLDRPWIETPFVFQGFELKNRDEIETLQSCCDYVYVDIDRGALSDAEIRSLMSSHSEKTLPKTRLERPGAPAMGMLSRLRDRLRSMGGAGKGSAAGAGDSIRYEITSTVRREAPAAKEAYEHALSRYRAIGERARAVGEVSYDKASNAVKPLVASILRNPDAMAWTIFSKKRGARNYSRAVATSVWSVMFGRHLGFELADLHDLAIGGLLLDIGNTGIPKKIVAAEGSITHEQYENLSRHVQIGQDILEKSGRFSDSVLHMVRYHHERADGSGYPKKKVGNHIPVFGRMAGIADCYDAMTTKTSYSPALAAYDAARELNDMRGKEFQSEVVGQFLKMIGMFPTGSVVELSDGLIGIVLEQNKRNPLRPKVMLLQGSDGDSFEHPQIFDMQRLTDNNAGTEAVSIAKGHEHGAFGIDPLNYFA